jgi:hypothetical protein
MGCLWRVLGILACESYTAWNKSSVRAFIGGKMKKGDKVYVNWPTGKGGPYDVIAKNHHGIRIKVVHNDDSCDFISINRSWCEPAKPELEDERLYYYWDGDKALGRDSPEIGKYIDPHIWDHVEPVHRRWDELKANEQFRFKDSMYENYIGKIGVDDVFKKAYKLITGEEHP